LRMCWEVKVLYEKYEIFGSKKACLKIDQLIICRWIESVKVIRVMRAILALDR